MNAQELVEVKLVRRTITNNVQRLAKPDTDELKHGFAPHLLSLFGCGYMAINSFCIVIMTVLEKWMPASGNDHEVHIVNAAITRQQRMKITEFLDLLQLDRVYKFEIFNAESPAGVFSEFSVISAIANATKSLRIAPEDTEKLIEHFFKLDGDTIDSLNGKVLAIHSDWYRGVHYCHDLYDVENGFFSDMLDEVYDFIFMRTELHKVEEEEKLERLDVVVKETIEKEEEKEGIVFEDGGMEEFYAQREADVTKMISFMKSISNGRFESIEEGDEQQEPTNALLRACHLAMSNLVETNQIRGFEVQKAGVILIMNSGSFRKVSPLETVASSVASFSTRPVTQVEFTHFHMAPGVQGLLPSEIEDLETYSFSIKKTDNASK